MATLLEQMYRGVGLSAPYSAKTKDRFAKQAGYTPLDTGGADYYSPATNKKPTAYSAAKPKQSEKKYGLIDGRVKLPSHIENQGLYDLSEKSKFDYFTDAVAKNTVGGITQTGQALWQDLSGDTGKTAREYYDYVQQTAYNPYKAGDIQKYWDKKQTSAKDTMLNTNTLGYKMLESADEDMSKATEGMNNTGKFLVNAASTVAQNAYVAPIAITNPAIAAGLMATSTFGRNVKQRSDSGVSLQTANIRGAIDGYIDYLIGRIGIDSTVELLLGKGGALKNIGKNILSEAGEEAAAYIANFSMDKIGGNPNVEFDNREFWLNTLAGGIAGGATGVGSAVVGNTFKRANTDVANLPIKEYIINKRGGYNGEETSSRYDTGRIKELYSEAIYDAGRNKIQNNGGKIDERRSKRRFRSVTDQSSERIRYEQIVDSPVFYAKNFTGVPLRLYHATNADFDEFKAGKTDIGIHFGTLEQATEIFTSKKGHRIIEVELDIKNPIYIGVDDFGTKTEEGYFEIFYNTSDLSDNDIMYIKNHSGRYNELIRMLKIESVSENIDRDNIMKILDEIEEISKIMMNFSADEKNNFVNRNLEKDLKVLGYDGIVYHNDYEGKGLSYAVFDNNQIKQINKNFK